MEHNSAQSALDAQNWHPPHAEIQSVNTPVGSIENERKLTPAEQLGLVDGQFIVQRGSGEGSYTETGWTVAEIGDDTDENTGEQRQFAILTNAKLGADGKPLRDDNGYIDGDTKNQWVDVIRSWQPVEHETPSESLLSDRQREIFAPVEKVTKKVTVEDEDKHWDAFILSPEDYKAKYGSQPPEGSVKDAAVRDDSGINREVSSSSLEYAQMTIEGNIDPTVKRIIAEFSEGATQTTDLVNNIRTNPRLRERLALYFMDKIKLNLNDMPERVQRDAQKKPNHKGYEKLSYTTSREYASLLALSMLDGTFKFEATKTDPIVRDGNGEVEVGQHRAAAEILLYG